MTRNEKKIVFFTFTAHFLFHYYELAFPALAVPLMATLQMDLPEVLKLGFPMYLAFGIFALPWGYFADRFTNRTALIICFLGSGLGAMLLVFSTSPAMITASLGIIGAFACICHPAGMGLISIGVRNRGMALGINSIAGSIGLLTAPFLAGLCNWLAGWRTAYLAAAIFAVLGGVAMLLVKIDEAPHTPGNLSAAGEATPGPPGTRRNNRLLLLILFFGIVTLGGLTYRINIVVLPAYLEYHTSFLAPLLALLPSSDTKALTTMAAGLLTSFVYLVGIAGQLMGGRLADRRDLRYLYLAFNVVSLPFIVLMAFATEGTLVLAAAGYVFFALGIQPVENSLIAWFTPEKWRSTGYGFASVLIFGVGALAIYLVGWVKTVWSLGAVYYFSGGMIILILGGIILLLHMTKGSTFRNHG